MFLDLVVQRCVGAGTEFDYAEGDAPLRLLGWEGVWGSRERMGEGNDVDVRRLKGGRYREGTLVSGLLIYLCWWGGFGDGEGIRHLGQRRRG